MKLSEPQLAALRVLAKGKARICRDTDDYGTYRHVQRRSVDALIRQRLAENTWTPGRFGYIRPPTEHARITEAGREALEALAVKP